MSQRNRAKDGKGARAAFSRHFKIYLAIIFFASVLVASQGGYIYGFAVGSYNNIVTTIEPGAMVQGYSYIVYTDGAAFYAKSGTTGSVDYTSLNATSVIQNVITASPNGSVIDLKLGTFTLDTSIYYKSKITLEGMGMNTTVLNWAKPDYAFKPANPAVSTQNLILRDFTINIQADIVGIGGILMASTTWSQVEGVRIIDTAATKNYSIGVKLYESVGGLGAYFNSFTDDDVRFLHTGYLFAAIEPNSNTIRGGRIQGCVYGVKQEEGNYNWIYNTDLEGNNHAIYVTGGYMSGASGCDIESNTVDDIYVAKNYAYQAIGMRSDIVYWYSPGTVELIGASYGGNTSGILRNYDTGVVNTVLWSTTGIPISGIGTSWYDAFGLTTTTEMDFGRWLPTSIRLVVSATANNAAGGKGFAIYAGSTQLCNVTWSGTSQPMPLAGSWTKLNVGLTDTTLTMKEQLSNALETITLYRIEVQFQ